MTGLATSRNLLIQKKQGQLFSPQKIRDRKGNSWNQLQNRPSLKKRSKL